MSDVKQQSSLWTTMRFAFLVATVCALMVSITAVQLRQHYVNNLEHEKLTQLHGILEAIGIDTSDDLHGQLQSVAISVDPVRPDAHHK